MLLGRIKLFCEEKIRDRHKKVATSMKKKSWKTLRRRHKCLEVTRMAEESLWWYYGGEVRKKLKTKWELSLSIPLQSISILPQKISTQNFLTHKWRLLVITWGIIGISHVEIRRRRFFWDLWFWINLPTDASTRFAFKTTRFPPWGTSSTFRKATEGFPQRLKILFTHTHRRDLNCGICYQNYTT